MSVNPIPEDYHRVTPYLLVKDIPQLILFLETVFDAEVIEKIPGPGESIMHAEVKIGDSIIMMGTPSNEFNPSESMLYIYCEDTDAFYQRALSAGAKSIMAPADQFYGDRNAGVEGPQGNYWWLASRKETLSEKELLERAAKMADKS